MELDQWEKLSIVAWKRILEESIESKDAGREKYARWMLSWLLPIDHR